MCLAGQMKVVQDIHQGLLDEYTLRRKMLIERAKVTLDSLLRSAQLEDRGTSGEARRVAEQGRERMVAEPLVSLDNVFHACQGVQRAAQPPTYHRNPFVTQPRVPLTSQSQL